MKKYKLRWWHLILMVILLLNVYLYATGKVYYYKALVYNYVNIDDLELFPSRTVKSGKPEPWKISVSYNKATLTPLLRKTLEEYNTVAFLAVKNDSICYEEYWDNYNQSSLSNSFSMAKSIVSILVGIAVDEGKINNLDEPVCRYIPEFCNSSNKDLTIRQLLMMSSGLNWDEGYTSLTSPVTAAYYGTDLRKQMLELKVVETPGRKLNYMSSNTQILSFILTKATGMSLSDYASQKLWIPIGAEHDAMWSLDHKNGDEKAYCCFYSNARDFARIGKLFLQKGKWNGKQVISEKFVSEAVTPTELLDDGKPNSTYGYHWWITEVNGEKVFYARGILGQYIFVIPGLNLIIIRLGHKRGEKNADGTLPDISVYLNESLKIFGGKDYI
jgi:CubicO group peptidase (beta-lactamase class C family)